MRKSSRAPVDGTGESPAPETPDGPLDDEAIRQRVASLHREHGEELRRFLLGVTRDPDLAAEAAQAAFCRALERGGEVNPEKLKAWLFEVAFREALAVRRRGQAGDRATQKLADLIRAGRGEGQGGEADGASLDGLIRAETVEAVKKRLGELPDEQRRVVTARIYDDRTFAEIASEQGLPLGTVLTRMRRALERLRKALQAPSDDPPDSPRPKGG